MDAHVAMAPLPVEHGGQRLAGLRQRLAVARDMHDLALVLAVDGRGDGDIATRPAQPAGVARLAAAGGVEDGSVEHDAAPVVDRDDRRFGFGQIGVAAEEEFGHGRCPLQQGTDPSPAGAIGKAGYCGAAASPDAVFAASSFGWSGSRFSTFSAEWAARKPAYCTPTK